MTETCSSDRKVPFSEGEKGSEQPKINFKDIPIREELTNAIADLGFEYCTPIQAKVLPWSLNGNDIIGKSQTGTGKTAAFLITIIQDLLENPIKESIDNREPRALIISPTRELAMQIAEDAKQLCCYTRFNIATLVGRMDYEQQKQAFSQPVSIVVATPGRLLDFCSRGDLFLNYIETLVIDEADLMLDMGFYPQVQRIVRMTPIKKYRQTLLFSATINSTVRSLVKQWTQDAHFIEVNPESIAAKSVNQVVYIIETEAKFQLLHNLIIGGGVDSAIIFVNRRDECQKLFKRMKTLDHKVAMINGDLDQKVRIKNLELLKQGKIQALIATDVAGRGIHIKDVSHVINYNLPEDPEDYVHRIGRTGRAGKTGVSISFACEQDSFMIEPIEALLGHKLLCQRPPNQQSPSR